MAVLSGYETALSECCISIIGTFRKDVLNLVDRILIDELWVGHTKAWTIPGTEDLKPYINKKDRIKKWLTGTVGFALMSCIAAGVMSAVLQLW